MIKTPLIFNWLESANKKSGLLILPYRFDLLQKHSGRTYTSYVDMLNRRKLQQIYRKLINSIGYIEFTLRKRQFFFTFVRQIDTI